MEKHLDYIQNAINRMANNSFLIKGWAVTLVSLLFVLGVRDSSISFLLLSFLPLFSFWGLDAYYLRQEKLYRELYNAVRTGTAPNDYSMNANKFKSKVDNWLVVMFSASILPIYIAVMLLNFALLLFVIHGVI